MGEVADLATTEVQEAHRKEAGILEQEEEDPRTLAAACRLLPL